MLLFLSVGYTIFETRLNLIIMIQQIKRYVTQTLAAVRVYGLYSCQ